MQASCALTLGAVIVTAVGTAACAPFTSCTLPDRCTVPRDENAAAVLRAIDVAVEPFEYPQYADWLTAALHDSGMFRRVARADAIQDAALVARIESKNTSAPITLLAWLTFGLVPEWGSDRYGYCFSVRRHDQSAPAVRFDCAYEGTSVVGWLGALRNVGEDYAFFPPEESDRFHEFVANSLWSQAAALAVLIEGR